MITAIHPMPSKLVYGNEGNYVAFAWSDAEKVYPIVTNLASKYDVAFFDISNKKVIYPDGFVLDLSDDSNYASNSFLMKLRNFFHI